MIGRALRRLAPHFVAGGAPFAVPVSTASTSLLPHLLGKPRKAPVMDAILAAYGPQLGEMIWHSVHHDARIEGMVEQQGAVMLALIERYGLQAQGRPIRILEVGAYSHYTVHEVAGRLGGVGVANDISPAALRVGGELARAKGIAVDGTLVASDFHELPFSSGYFDLAFISSAVHHTFRPWIVLDELFRVVRPGGVVHLENEPVGRVFSLYQFRCNRDDRRTPFELEVERLGLTRTLSSPFPGSRDEELFGMIENDCIPLDTYLDAFARNGETLSLELNYAVMFGPVEQAVLTLPRDGRLVERLVELLSAPLREVAALFTERDLLLGFSLPRREQVWMMCYAAAAALRTLPPPEAPSYRARIASLFGAALCATIRRTDGTQSDTLLRRPLPKRDGVYLDFPDTGALRLDLLDPRLPEINTAAEPALAAAYPRADWERIVEPLGFFTLVNRGGRAVIRVPALDDDGLLLLRYYAVAKEHPYMVQLSVEGREIASDLVVINESHLLRALVPAGTRGITLLLTLLDGTPIEDNRSLHLAVAQLVRVRCAA